MVNRPVIPIDYTNLGYDSLREAMLALARQSLPELTDFSENDLGVLLIELFAYACDITLYYQTRIAGNLFPATSDEPNALVQLLRLIGYELRPPAPATADLRVAFDTADVATVATSITIQAGTAFSVSLSTGEQLTYETERALQIRPAQLTPPDDKGLQYFFPVPIVQGQTVLNETVAISDGTANQMYPLQQKPVIAGSISVVVKEPGDITTYWQEVDTLANSSPADRHFVVQRDAEGGAALLFGDGINGMIPPPSSTPGTPVTITATYRIGGGPQGNVPANTRFTPSLPAKSGTIPIREATNVQAAAGGTSAEDIERARLFAPHHFRTQERAVTLQDYTDLALQVPGVGKALAVALNWNQVVLYIAPTGQVTEPSELLKRDLLFFFESRRMATTTLKLVGPKPADIYLGATIRAQPYFLQSDVQAAVEKAVADYLDFDAVDFGQPIYLSKIYDVVQDLPQVASLTVFKFSRNPVMIIGQQDVDSDGIIDLAPYELARPGYRDNPDPNTAPDPKNPTYRPSIFTIIQGGVAPGGAR